MPIIIANIKGLGHYAKKGNEKLIIFGADMFIGGPISHQQLLEVVSGSF